jgi:hypothetical protein
MDRWTCGWMYDYCTAPRALRQYMVMSTVRIGIKSDCAGEDQQRFTLPPTGWVDERMSVWL